MKSGLRARRLAAIYRAAPRQSRALIAAALIANTARALEATTSHEDRQRARLRAVHETIQLLAAPHIDPAASSAARHLAIVRALAPAFQP